MEINYIEGRHHFTSIRTGQNGVPYLAFEPLERFDFIRHGFSTRLGGVSGGIFSSMNLSDTRGDSPENVRENFILIGEALSCPNEDMVYAMQTHTSNVLKADSSMKGCGVIRPRTYRDVDALVTNETGVCLVTGHADCIPLYFVDPIRRAIGLAHSGWMGTLLDIAGAVVEKMTKEYGSNPEDIVGLSGPGICGRCYEVGEDVAERFIQKYRGSADVNRIVRVKDGGPTGKYLLDLHEACRVNMLNADLMAKNVYISDICTMENPKLLFSHRGMKGQRGGMCAFLEISIDQ